MARPALDFITIKGFKSIREVERLELGARTVLVGPNGCGKSNFIGLFGFLHALREGRLQEYVGRAGGADALLHFGARNTETIDVHISFANQKNQYEISLGATENDELLPMREEVSFWDRSRFDTPRSEDLPRRGKEAGISDPGLIKTAGWVRKRMSRWRVYHFHDTGQDSPMKKVANVDDNRFLRPNGSNLAPFLYFLKKRHEATYDLIRRSIQRVTPFFDDFQVQPSQLNPDKIKLEWRHRDSDQYFGPAALSDGTLRFMVLATLLLQPAELRPSVILVDEPELGLHPYAITMLASMIKMASAETQVIVSTQSPLLLDHFEPEDVLVADRVDGGTVFNRLSTEKLADWLQEYSLGQLWEKNELGGRPKG